MNHKIRAGTRWYRRGIDKDGNVANFVETEQIVESGEGDRASFVQVSSCKVNQNYKLGLDIVKLTLDILDKRFNSFILVPTS